MFKPTPTILARYLFQTLQVFLSRSEDVHGVWLSSLDFILSLFSQFELSLFFLLLPKPMDTGYLVNATSPTILAGSF